MHPEVPIQVAVRVRPLLGEEIYTNPDPCLYCVPSKPQLVIGKNRSFSFDYVFPPESSQTDVYCSCVKPLIPSFFEGYNTTVFAYGQTGSGKTYTMGTGNRVYLDEEECGVVPRTLTDIFDEIAVREGSSICKIRVSFIEVYKEEITDLLENSTKNLQIREDSAGNAVIVGLREEPAGSMEEVLNLLDAGTAIRHVGSTNMNDVSSRSHCLFTLILDQYALEESETFVGGNVLTSRFHFVDLAGSERANRTGNQGERFKESVFINTGLLALGNVISALSDSKRKGLHVPYRESKLTRLLKDSLGGNSRTLMITCLSCALQDLDENINSLKYATRANCIRNKPVVNWDIQSSKLSRMESEIQVLRGQLQRKASDQVQVHQAHQVQVQQKISHLELENDKHEVTHDRFLQSLHEVNVLLQAVESAVPLPMRLVEEILNWRHNWSRTQFDRPVTAPSQNSVVRRPQYDVVEKLRCEISKLKEQLCKNEVNNHDIEDLKQEVIAFGQENAQLRLDLDVAINNENHLLEKLFEHQLVLQNMKNSLNKNDPYRASDELNTPVPVSPQARIIQSLRTRNNLLVSQIDDMSEVVIDENISSDEDEDKKVVEIRPYSFLKQKSEPSMSRGRRFSSKIPRLTNHVCNTNNKGPDQLPRKNSVKEGRLKLPLLNLSYSEEDDTLSVARTSRDTAQRQVRLSEIHMREMNSRIKELESHIQQKEGLINELAQSEKEARATNDTYHEKLTKLEREYDKSKRELEESRQKLQQYGTSVVKDTAQKSKLDVDYKKKLKVMQKKFDDLKQKETVSNRIASYQEINEKKVKDLEACIARMKNQQAELEGKFKSESDKKIKFEQELRKNELCLNELERKTHQQEKMLKRKNEEVATAQRKLRHSAGHADHHKTDDELEKKHRWIDQEIEKILARQRDIDVLESELRERDKSLQKKEELMSEKDFLEVKRSKSSQIISKSILQLSTQMEAIDEQISDSQLKDGQDLQRLQDIKEELTQQKTFLEQAVDSDGLEPHEQRRLIELTEAIEAVDDAIDFKNELINKKQSSLTNDDEQGILERLFNDMGSMSIEEYKNLLGKLFFKIVELRKLNDEGDDARLHFEIKISEQEKNLHELQRMLQVVEARHERKLTEQTSIYERDMRFLMQQLRELESDSAVKEQSMRSGLEKKINALEKELYYYKVKSRKYKDHLKDFTNVSIDSSLSGCNSHTPTSNQQKYSQHDHTSQHYSGERGFHLPPVRSSTQSSNDKQMDKKYQAMEPYSQEEHRRLKEIFETKSDILSDNLSIGRSIKEQREAIVKKKLAADQSFQDSIEVTRHR